MIKIGTDRRTIYIHRGDEGILNYCIKTEDANYSFKVGDILRLSVFDIKSDYQNPLKEIKVEVTEESNTMQIPISTEDTNIGIASNKAQKYAYEISLNGVNTTSGYDEDEGHALLILLPAKGSDNSE